MTFQVSCEENVSLLRMRTLACNVFLFWGSFVLIVVNMNCSGANKETNLI